MEARKPSRRHESWRKKYVHVADGRDILHVPIYGDFERKRHLWGMWLWET